MQREKNITRIPIEEMGFRQCVKSDGREITLEHEERGLFFVHRGKTTGERIPEYMKKFLASKKKQRRVDLCVTHPKSGDQRRIKIRLIRGPDDNEAKPIVFVTNLVDRKKYSRGKILALYQKRWTVETLYGRVKNLLCLEKFHARSHNGVMQEIFANLLILSLTALAVTATVDEEGINRKKELPSSKNASEVVRRHLFSIIDSRINEIPPKKLMKRSTLFLASEAEERSVPRQEFEVPARRREQRSP